MPNLNLLNPPQRLAVKTINGPVLILAGAGTGKTRVITCRIAHMIEKGIAPGNILGVTFTNKAAREMQQRINSLVPRPSQNSALRAPHSAFPNRPTICTFHSLCVRILRQHIEKLGYKRNFVIYNESEQLGAVRKILSQISAKGERTDPAAILGLLSRFRNGSAPAAVFAEETIAAMAKHIRPRYETALRACNAVDFDDLILLTVRLFTEHPEALEACRARYRFVMVDEYQDTNPTQFDLVHALAKAHRNLCVVGDDDQSIYGWRGAEIRNLLEMERHFPEVKVITLEQNYRSTNTILTAANALIKNNARRRAKRLWSQKGQGPKILLHSFENEEEEARTMVEEIEFLRQAKRIPWSDQAVLFRTNLQARPLETALRQAAVRYRLVGGPSFFDRREVRDFLAYLKVLLNPNDDVSLLRIANVPARGLSEETMKRLLAASQERKCPVFDVMKNPAVLATFSTRCRVNIGTFTDFVERTRARLLNTSTRLSACPAEESSPGRASASAALGRVVSASFSTNLPLSRPAATLSPALSGGEGRERGRSVVPGFKARTLARRILSPPVEGRGQDEGRSSGRVQVGGKTGEGNLILSRWAEEFLAEIGYPEELRRSEKEAEAAENRLRNLKDLVASLDEVAGESRPAVERLQDFLEDLSLDTEREEGENSGDAVTLITMHSCKGLEFPHVYIVGLEDGLLPHSRSKVEGTLDEERRLFYVAITRAMQTLTLSHCSARKKFGQLSPCHPSPFLKELPADLVEHADARPKEPVPVDTGRDLFAAMRASLA
jgi:superfamily I DNA/RNA helicase